MSSQPPIKITRSFECKCPNRPGQGLQRFHCKYAQIQEDAHSTARNVKLTGEQWKAWNSKWALSDLGVRLRRLWCRGVTVIRPAARKPRHCKIQRGRHKRRFFVSSREIDSQERWCSPVASQLCQRHNEGCVTLLIDCLTSLQCTCRHLGLAVPVAPVLWGLAAANRIWDDERQQWRRSWRWGARAERSEWLLIAAPSGFRHGWREMRLAGDGKMLDGPLTEKQLDRCGRR